VPGSSTYRIVVALDAVETVRTAYRLVDVLCEKVYGFKLGLPLLLRHGPKVAGRLRSLCPSAAWIADLKLADIGAVMKATVETIIDDVDAVIAHSFVGARGALDELKEYLDARGRKLILVATMSHSGAEEVYDKALDLIDFVIERVQPWGLVAPATRPSLVERLRRKHPNTVILSPGVGAQGAKPGTALCHGADYEIVGRAITSSENPLGSLEEIGATQMEVLRQCRRERH